MPDAVSTQWRRRGYRADKAIMRSNGEAAEQSAARNGGNDSCQSGSNGIRAKRSMYTTEEPRYEGNGAVINILSYSG